MNVKLLVFLVVFLIIKCNVEEIFDGEKAKFEFNSEDLDSQKNKTEISPISKNDEEDTYSIFNNSYNENGLSSIILSSSDTDLENDLDIPEDQSQVDLSIAKSVKESEKNKNLNKNDLTNEVYEEEDQVAKYAFFIILAVLLLFMSAFVYNLIKCYLKAPNKEDFSDNETVSNQNVNNMYSRELGNINDDSIIDLSN